MVRCLNSALAVVSAALGATALAVVPGGEREGPGCERPSVGGAPLTTATVAGYGATISSGCAPAAVARDVRLAWSRMVSQGVACLAPKNLTLDVRVLAKLASGSIEISCLDPGAFSAKRSAMSEDGPSGGSSRQVGGNHDCGLGEVGGTHIFLSSEAFDPVRCGPLEGTLFHELLHTVGLHGSHSHDPTDLTDGVYGCELACFFPGTPDPARAAACANAQ